MVAVDCETPTAEWHAYPFMVSTAIREGDGIRSQVWDIPAERESLSFWLSNAGPMVFHNAKFDLQKLILAGVLIREGITPRPDERHRSPCSPHRRSNQVKKRSHLRRNI